MAAHVSKPKSKYVNASGHEIKTQRTTDHKQPSGL